MPPAQGNTPSQSHLCYIRNWTAFGPGYWNGGLYTAAECVAMGRHFARLSAGPRPAVVPSVKLAHDPGQDLGEWLRASKGLPSLGRVQAMRVGPGALCAFDLELPAVVGGLCNGGWYRDGSIEIAPPLPDPDDPTRRLYPVLVGFGLLGEEQPGVPLRHPMPRAAFADGAEVPADDGRWLLAAAATVRRDFAARRAFSFRGREYPTTAVCFSAMIPLTPTRGSRPMTDEQKAALAAPPFSFTPEQIAAMEQAMASAAADPAAGPPNPDPADPMAGVQPFAAAADTPPWGKAVMSALTTFAKRFNATEAAVAGLQKGQPAVEEAARFARTYQSQAAAEHRREVERAVDQAVLDGRLEPRDRADKVAAGLSKNNALTFSAGHAHAGQTEFDAWRAELAARAPSRFFSAAIPEPTPGDAAADPFVQATLQQMGPKGRAALQAAAAK